jgi:hypothetical protein
MAYSDREGNEVAVRFRISLDGNRRFVWRRGDKPCLYGLWRLSDQGDHTVTLVEGESDCHTLWLHDIPALGVPGAGNWNEARDACHFDGIETIYLVIEPDKGGEAVLKWLGGSIIKDRVRLLHLGCDVNEFYQKNRETFVQRWTEACRTAEPFKDHEARERNKVKGEAWTLAQHIAQRGNILDDFVDDLYRLQVAGEEKIAKITYLAATSRLFERPVSVGIKGPSAGGKSYVTEKVLSFFPESAYYPLTSMSEHALVYSLEPLKHRMLVLYEAGGLASDLQSYMVRSILSEGHLRYETVIKGPTGMECVLLEREGPTGLIVTTTAVSLHPENETRMLSLTVCDTPDQTKAIFSKIANGLDDEVDLEPWRAFQTWLELGETRVNIPYAVILAELIPPVDIRLRRDFTAILTLIKAHTLIHRQHRDCDELGRIIATVEDYEAVRELAEEFISENLGHTVPPAVREVVDAVEVLADKDGVTLAVLADEMRLDRSTVQRRAARAKRRGWLNNIEEKRNRPQRLVIGELLPDEKVILPTKEDLAASLCKCSVSTEGIDTPLPPDEEVPF